MTNLSLLNAVIEAHALEGSLQWFDDPNKILEVESHAGRRMGSRSESVWVTDGRVMTQALPPEFPYDWKTDMHHIAGATYAIKHLTIWEQGRRTDEIESLIVFEECDPTVLQERIEAILGPSLAPAAS